MKTYYLTSEKEIRDMLEQSLKVSEAKDYCNRLMGFFEQKLEDIIATFSVRETYGNDSKEAERMVNQLYKDYHVIDCDAYDLEEAFEDYRTARDHYNRIDAVKEGIVKSELKCPCHVEVDDPNDEVEIRETLLDIDAKFYDLYSNDIMPVNVCRIYQHSHGINKWFETELKEFLELYDLR